MLCSNNGASNAAAKSRRAATKEALISTEKSNLILTVPQGNTVIIRSTGADLDLERLRDVPSNDEAKAMVAASANTMLGLLNTATTKLNQTFTVDLSETDAALEALETTLTEKLTKLASILWHMLDLSLRCAMTSCLAVVGLARSPNPVTLVVRLCMAQANADKTSVAIANALKVAVADSKFCVSKGQALGKDGKCTWPVNMCNAKPTVDSGFKGRTATLKFEGDAAPGTVGSFDCGPGRYYSTAKTACKLDGKWSNLKAQCKKCTAHAHYAEGCQPPADGVFDSCKHTYQSGLKSGRYIIKENVATYAKTGKKYEAYCLNDNSLGWHLPTKGDGAGGGWEIVHTQSGGHFPAANNGRRSNADLRKSTKMTKLMPFDIGRTGLPTFPGDAKSKTSQMSNGWPVNNT